MEKIKQKILKLKQLILNFIANGGNIYAPKRELPYYDYMSYIVKLLKQQDPNITYEDVYALCGIEFNKDYYFFKNFLAELKLYNHGGFVDGIRESKTRATNNTYEKLKNYAEKYKTTPFDFLVLMTPYSFESCFIHTDNYEETLKHLILNKYPDKDISGIKRQEPELYEQLRQLQTYYPYPITMKDLVHNMGFIWPRASSKLPSIPNKQNVLDELNSLFPDKNIISLRQIDTTLYYKIIKLARFEKLSISEWLIKNGFNYSNAIKLSPLSQIKVDANSRAKLLQHLKQKQLENLNIQTANEIELYKASLKATQNVIAFINSKSATELLYLEEKLLKEQTEREQK